MKKSLEISLKTFHKTLTFPVNTAKLPPINPTSGGGKKSSLFAKELENILTKELETRHQSNPGPSPPQPGPKPGTITQGQGDAGAGSRPENKIPRPKRKGGGVPSEMNSSLRQRAPAMFLRKLDQVRSLCHRYMLFWGLLLLENYFDV